MTEVYLDRPPSARQQNYFWSFAVWLYNLQFWAASFSILLLNRNISKNSLGYEPRTLWPYFIPISEFNCIQRDFMDKNRARVIWHHMATAWKCTFNWKLQPILCLCKPIQMLCQNLMTGILNLFFKPLFLPEGERDVNQADRGVYERSLGIWSLRSMVY